MIYSGNLVQHQGRRIAIVVSRFNEIITEQLLKGAQSTLTMHGVQPENISVFWVPGAFEIPMVAKKLAATQAFDGIVTLGAVIKGDTAHYDLVINAAANGVANVSLTTDTPIVFGVVTTDTLEQAQHRAGAKAGNKGMEVTMSLLEVLSLYDEIATIG
ncbi:6,7-dimethyl-8-ribityllumazine synthase [Leuconostoc holzapfelii]|uniref:6,7-dimethyl-8-ribityllumazine synthase n=1 Tax=Leuconostoc holzapfelii TaxID=434464 RepID=A0ABT2NYY9_9LACO|nr:6,7-dimethyl-8-ribityllumazine synthase [Leuconostoc holzapfelii]MCT8389820.1 6,7-dimethyl-8-ribityllumazine synthase [Leuconostoc holzapfelii]